MRRIRTGPRLRAWIVIATLSLVALATLSGAGSAQTQAAPTNTGEPGIRGTAIVGAKLKATTGTWTGAPTSFGFQWTRCPASGGAVDASDCTAIGGATTSRYAPGGADVGKRLRVRVTATNADGSKTVASNPTAAVKPAGKLTNTARPTISGSATVGSTLTASQGTWSGTDPITFTYVWQRCATNGASCAPIGGGTGTTYLLKSVDLRNTIRVIVTATDSSGTSSGTSLATAVIRPAASVPPPAANGCAKTGGTMPVTAVSPPARLTIDQTQISPSTILYSTRSLTARFHVSACSGSIEGALVYVTAVPFGQFGIPNEQPTGSDGWATLQFSALAGYPASNKQQLLVMFVRARKAGESLLGGISTRRLVSFHVTRG